MAIKTRDIPAGTGESDKLTNTNGTGNTNDNNNNNTQSAEEEAAAAAAAEQARIQDLNDQIKELETSIEQLKEEQTEYRTMRSSIQEANTQLESAKTNISNAQLQFTTAYAGSKKEDVEGQMEYEIGEIEKCSTELTSVLSQIDIKLENLRTDINNMQKMKTQLRRLL